MKTLDNLVRDVDDIAQDAEDFVNTHAENNGDTYGNMVLILSQLDALEKRDGIARWSADQIVLIEAASTLVDQWESDEDDEDEDEDEDEGDESDDDVISSAFAKK